jgi:hypothetical protein
MKPAIQIFLLLCGCTLSNARAGDPAVQAVRHKKPVRFEDTGQLTTNVIMFFQSASIDATVSGGGEPRWQAALASDSYIHLTFATPRTFPLPVTVQGVSRREPKAVTEILVSLPEGHYPAIQWRNGTNYMALTKWQPSALHQLLKEPALKLDQVAPYDHFYRLKDSSGDR